MDKAITPALAPKGGSIAPHHAARQGPPHSGPRGPQSYVGPQPQFLEQGRQGTPSLRLPIYKDPCRGLRHLPCSSPSL